MFKRLLYSLVLIGFFATCKEDIGSVNENQAPNTTFSVEAINLTGENRLNSLVTLSWFGTDPDGYVTGYELSFDQITWNYTKSQDSTFKFIISAGSDTSDINFYVRAIDNENLRDPSPDYLRIPIRNTIPTAKFSDKLVFKDTCLLVATTGWNANDVDGDETITDVYLSLDGVNWTAINKTKKTISIVPQNPTSLDSSNALIYYNNELNPASIILPGLAMNDTNKLYIKSVDQAGEESLVDTSLTFYMKGKVNDVLLVGGAGSSAKTIYKSTFSHINVPVDFLDLLVANGLYRPQIWNITFRLQLSFYDKLFFFSDETSYLNSYSNVSSLLLEFAASSLQQYANSGGKYLITTKFDHNQNIDGFVGVLPLSGVSTKNYGSARLYGSDSLTSKLNGFPELQGTNPNPTSVIPGIGVFYIDSLDTEVLYEAQIVDQRPTIPWTDTKIIASGRRVNGKLNQVYFGMPLWELNRDPAKLDQLFNQVFNVEFN